MFEYVSCSSEKGNSKSHVVYSFTFFIPLSSFSVYVSYRTYKTFYLANIRLFMNCNRCVVQQILLENNHFQS